MSGENDNGRSAIRTPWPAKGESDVIEFGSKDAARIIERDRAIAKDIASLEELRNKLAEVYSRIYELEEDLMWEEQRRDELASRIAIAEKTAEREAWPQTPL